MRFSLRDKKPAAGDVLERRIGVQLRSQNALRKTGGGAQRKQALVSGTQEKTYRRL